MKMGNIASPWRYDIGACVAPQSPKLRRPAIPRYASMLNHNLTDDRDGGDRGDGDDSDPDGDGFPMQWNGRNHWRLGDRRSLRPALIPSARSWRSSAPITRQTHPRIPACAASLIAPCEAAILAANSARSLVHAGLYVGAGPVAWEKREVFCWLRFSVDREPILSQSIQRPNSACFQKVVIYDVGLEILPHPKEDINVVNGAGRAG
jgi:hypothetical protein